MGRWKRYRALGIFGAVAVLTTLLVTAGLLPRPAGPPPEAYARPDVRATDEAIAFFRARLSGDPNNGPIAARLADRYAKRFGITGELRDLERAEGWARRAVPLSRDEADARARLASILLAQHAFGEALSEAERAVSANPRDGGAWAVVHDAAFAAGRYAHAEKALGEIGPGVARDVRMALWSAARGDDARAGERLAAACSRMATWSRPVVEAACWIELGHLAAGEGEEHAAERLYAHALELAPGARGAVEGFADLAYSRGNFDTAESLYRRIAVDAHPDLYLRLAEIREERGDSSGARRWERAFTRVVTDPERERLYGRELALYLADRPERRGEALSLALREVDRRPTVESWDVLAWVRYLSDDPHGALVASDRAFAWGSPTPTMQYHRARILAALGRTAEAEHLLDQALQQAEALEPHVRRHHGELPE